METTARRKPSLRALILPREHGSWSLALEPLALGLIAAPSWPGAAVALAAIAIFFTRRPLQATRTGDVRAGTAIAVVVALGLAAAGALAFAVPSANPSTARAAVLALVGALPAAGAFMWFDRRRAGREMAAELCGAAVFAAFPVAIVLLAGWAWPAALVPGLFALARSHTSILTIRAYLRRRKSQTASAWPAAMVTLAAVGAFTACAAQSHRWLPAIWTLVFAARTWWLLGPRAPAWPARRLGIAEAVLGVLVTVSTALALR